MASTFGKYFAVTLGGTSHGPVIRVTIKGTPVGTVIDYNELSCFMSRRSAEGLSFATGRKEPDEINFITGIANFGGEFGIVTKDIIEAFVENKDAHSADYEEYRDIPRPGHADFTAIMKDGEAAEIEGGGRFSGRLTVGLCIAGGIAKQLLEKRGITVMTDIIEIAGDKSPMDFEDIIMAAKAKGDSVGGIIECGVTGLEPGSCGDSYFDGLEGRIAEAVFGIPAVKAIEFGNGFECARLLGSENNDSFFYDEDGQIRTKTNNHGGILGGIATGMPIILRCAVKPTPSIAIEQDSVNLKTGENVKISVRGRHDPCIVPRALPCVEAAVSIAILDALMEEDAGKRKAEDSSTADAVKAAPGETLEEARRIIDEQNKVIIDALKKRTEAAVMAGQIKKKNGLAITDIAREESILTWVENESEDYGDEFKRIFRTIIEETKNIERKK